MEYTVDFINTKIDRNGKEYYEKTFTVPSTNIRVMDTLRKELREYDSWFNAGGHTGCLYNTAKHEVYFTVGIPVTEMFHYAIGERCWDFDITTIFENVCDRIKNIEEA